MDKNQQILLGVAVVGIGGYLLWKSKQPKKSFMNAGGTCDRNGRAGWSIRTNSNGVKVCSSPDGYQSYRVNMSGKMGLNGLKGLDVPTKLVNRRSLEGLKGLASNKLVNRRMVGMINSTNVQEGTFRGLINNDDVQGGPFSTKRGFTPENLGSDLLSVKNSNFFDQNILASKF